MHMWNGGEQVFKQDNNYHYGGSGDQIEFFFVMKQIDFFLKLKTDSMLFKSKDTGESI